MPFRTPGSDLPRRRGFATTVPVVDAFATPWSPASTTELGSPSTRPLPRESRFSGPRRRSPTSATEFDARTRLRAVDPRPRVRLSPRYCQRPVALGRTKGRCWLRWLHGCVAAPRACEPRLARTGFHRRVPLAWTKQVTGRSTRGRRTRALDDSACPSRGAPGTRVTGSIHHLAWTTW